MNNTNKYVCRFFPVKAPGLKWTEKTHIEKAPTWCSVDLRDGNQSLMIPMSIKEKLEYFKLLVKIGFKEIEVGFPAASETEFTFLRTLIENDLIPEDVTIQVLTQSREHIIRKTFTALSGCKNAIIHLYNPTSYPQREQVFCKKNEEIISMAISGAKLMQELAEDSGIDYIFEYSPESFTETEPEFALEICNAVLDVWKPTSKRNVIINLPATVELSSPHVYANQVEFISDNIKYRDAVKLSIHPHNDRGCAIADAELGLLAGADRIEGTLFGNGERTGNADIITLALNMYTQGIDPMLNITNLPEITDRFEFITKMQIAQRHPYSGKLVFAAFSGAHQDAIAKGLKWREERENAPWNVPYLPIDPVDIGREHETDIIRINSQSGKGGISYLLEHNFGYYLPYKMREEVSYAVKHISDLNRTELSATDVYGIFKNTYINISDPIRLLDFQFVRKENVSAEITVEVRGKEQKLFSKGNGRLDAVANAIKGELGIKFSDLFYEEHALTLGSSSKAVTYVRIRLPDGRKVWGVGIHDDIMASSINALFSAVNRSLEKNLDRI